MIRFSNRGALVGFDPIPIPYVLLFPLIGAIIKKFTLFRELDKVYPTQQAFRETDRFMRDNRDLIALAMLGRKDD